MVGPKNKEETRMILYIHDMKGELGQGERLASLLLGIIHLNWGEPPGPHGLGGGSGLIRGTSSWGRPADLPASLAPSIGAEF